MLFAYLAALVLARARDRRPGVAATADRAGGQAGGDARAPRARSHPPRRRHRVERRRVPGARRRLPTAVRHAWRSRSRCLRRLWTESSVAHTGATEVIDAAGLAPLPPTPVPIWIGCGTDSRAVARVGRLADGWLPEPTVQPGRGLEPAWAEVRAAATAAGRDPDALGLEGQVWSPPDQEARLPDRLARWRDAGADAVGINSGRAGDPVVGRTPRRAVARRRRSARARSRLSRTGSARTGHPPRPPPRSWRRAPRARDREWSAHFEARVRSQRRRWRRRRGWRPRAGARRARPAAQRAGISTTSSIPAPSPTNALASPPVRSASRTPASSPRARRRSTALSGGDTPRLGEESQRGVEVVGEDDGVGERTGHGAGAYVRRLPPVLAPLEGDSRPCNGAETRRAVRLASGRRRTRAR